MDQRTRERLPVLPVLTRTAAERKNATASRLRGALATPPGEIIGGTGGTLRRAVAPTANGRHVWAEDTAAGKRRNLSYEEEEAFWAFAVIEVLRLTGIRCEELLELAHHGITEYRLPTTGELVPLLQIAPSKQELLHRYAVWHLLRRLRRRTSGGETTHNQLVCVRRHVRAAIVLLDWLTARGLTLATCGQGDLEVWMTSPGTTHRREAGHFVRWASAQKLTSLEFPATKWGGPARTIDTEARWEQARRLLHDTELKPEDRVAGLLVLLYAQGPSTISRLTLDHVQLTDGEVLLRLGREPVVLPEPLAGLTRQLTTARHGHAAIGDRGTSRWLFPGGQPGRPISCYQLNERLRQLGLHPGQDRSTALLARMLGIHIAVAVAWQRASSGDWTSYAGDVSRRTST